MSVARQLSCFRELKVCCKLLSKMMRMWTWDSFLLQLVSFVSSAKFLPPCVKMCGWLILQVRFDVLNDFCLNERASLHVKYVSTCSISRACVEVFSPLSNKALTFLFAREKRNLALGFFCEVLLGGLWWEAGDILTHRSAALRDWTCVLILTVRV